MKIYIAIIADRHTDVEAHVFTQPDAAVAFARATAIENARDGEADLEEETIQGWLYNARYSPEGDAVWVVEKALDDTDYDPTSSSSGPAETTEEGATTR